MSYSGAVKNIKGEKMNDYKAKRRQFLGLGIVTACGLSAGGLEFLMGCAQHKDIKKPEPEQPPKIEEEPTGIILDDDFTELNKKVWKVQRDGKAFYEMTPEGIKLVVPNTASTWRYSNLAIYNQYDRHPYKHNFAQIRLKCENLEKGSMGWIFWNSSMNYKKAKIAGFVRKLGPEDYHENMFGTQTADKGKRILTPINNVSLEEWHTYSIDWREDSVRFWIDDDMVVEHKSGVPTGKTKFDFWIDNAVYVRKNDRGVHSYQKLEKTTALHVDYLRIMKLAEPYKSGMFSLEKDTSKDRAS